MQAGGADSPCSPLGHNSKQLGNRGAGSNSPAQSGGHGARGPSGPWARPRRGFFRSGISPVRDCYFPAGITCGEPVSVVDGTSPRRRGKRAWVMMNVELHGSTFVM